MKKENGLTIISVLIYIIALLIILGVVATLTSYFYKNINIEGESQLTNAQFTKFSGYITEEINQDGVRVVEVGENENVTYITFTNKQTYTYSKVNKAIYVNEIKICQNIDKCNFSYTEEDNRDKRIVDFKSGNFERTTSFITKQ